MRTLVVCICDMMIIFSHFLLPITEVAAGQAPSSPVLIETVVAPLAGEDLAEPCHYSLRIPGENRRLRGVWVIFDRGRDVHDLAGDPDVIAFARRLDLAILLQSHCPGKLAADHGDMNMDPAKGLGPALLRSLIQFAKATSHPELSEVDLILLGFSGAGPLSGRLIGAYSHRILAGVLSAPGHYAPEGIDTVRLNRDAQQVPQLIIAGGADDRSGTRLPYEYFAEYRRQGAPWTFVVQNRSPHCCTANVKPLMLDWLSAVIARRMPARSGGNLRRISQKSDWLGFVRIVPTTMKDAFGLETFNAAGVEIRHAKPSESTTPEDASWLPNAAVAREWLSFVEKESHPILPLR